MLKIRLSMGGAKKRPVYKIVVADSRFPSVGRFIEKVGFFNKKLTSLLLTEITAKMLVRIATTNNIKRISLSLSSLIFPVDFVESLIKQVYNKDLIPYFPLSGLDDNVFETAKEIGLEKYLSRIKKLGSSKFYNFKQSSKKIEKIVEESIMSKKIVLISVGPNNVHEILDEVRSDH